MKYLQIIQKLCLNPGNEPALEAVATNSDVTEYRIFSNTIGRSYGRTISTKNMFIEHLIKN